MYLSLFVFFLFFYLNFFIYFIYLFLFDSISNLGKKLNYITQKDWYKLSAKKLTEHGGKALVHRYNGSPASVVMGVFREEDWKPWLFHTKAVLKWTEPLKLQFMEYPFCPLPPTIYKFYGLIN
jgi:hypothetical protein